VTHHLLAGTNTMLSIAAPTLAENRASSAVLIPHIFTTSGHSTLGSLVSAQSRSSVINVQVSLACICQSFPNKDSANALLHVPPDVFPPGDATECTQDNFLALHHVGETQCRAHVTLKLCKLWSFTLMTQAPSVSTSSSTSSSIPSKRE